MNQQLSNEILTLVCTEFGVSLEELKSQSRRQRIVLPRQIACYLMHNLYDDPQPQEIAAVFGQNRTTALWAIDCIKERMDVDPALKQWIENAKEKLYVAA